MHWKTYRETAGKPPTHEVTIQFDSRDFKHPWVLARKALYEARGMKVVQRPVDMEKRHAQPRQDRGTRAVAQPSGQ